MPDRIALKRLTASDLTFFENLLHKLNSGNQKAINLNADVFIDQLYPGLPALTPTIGDVIPVTLTILGPAGAAGHVLSRAVTKREAYKNWRLNGEFVRDPDGEAGRFDGLSAGDLAVMEFGGDPAPKQLTLLLISGAATEDAPLHKALNGLIPGGRKTRIGGKQREILWAIFERVRSGLAERKSVTWAEVFGRLADQLAAQTQHPFDHAVVDEAQDLGVAEARFLRVLAGSQPDGLFFAGDLGQRIFQQPFSWKALGLDVRGRSFALRIAKLVALAEAGDIEGLKAVEINPVSTSPKAMARYRDLAIIAIEALDRNSLETL